jgi:hypothetical protein
MRGKKILYAINNYILETLKIKTKKENNMTNV